MADIKDRIALQGFTKEAMALVREAEDLGWTFRQSNHGTVGQAPDGRTTMSIGRKSSSRNRAYQNARAVLLRWQRGQEAGDVGASTDRPVIVASGPWKSSNLVLERQWSDGRVDYTCAFPGCGYTSFKPRAVSGHYGNAHTAWRSSQGDHHVPEEIPVLVTPVESEPVPVPETANDVDAGDGITDDAEHPLPLPDGDVITAVTQEYLKLMIPLIAGPLIEERERLLGRILELEQERDAAVKRMAKMRHDLKALSGLLDEIDE